MENEEEPYNIELRVGADENFPYVDCQTQNLALYDHELSNTNKKYTFTKSWLSPDNNYIALLGKGQKDDIIFIWEIKDIFKCKFQHKGRKIHGLQFSPRSNSYVIVYEDKEPIYYNIKNGRRICKFKGAPTDLKESGKILSYSFSSKAGYFQICYQKKFGIWKTYEGKPACQLLDCDGNLKYFRGKTLVCIGDNKLVMVAKLPFEEEPKYYKLKDINEEILDVMINEDQTAFYFSTPKSLHLLDLTVEKNNLSKVMDYDEENIKKAQICEDCTRVIVSNLRKLYFYDIIDKNKIGTILKENFKTFNCDFSKDILLTLDDICVNVTDYGSDTADEKFIFFDQRVTKFQNFTFSPDFEYLLAIIDDHSAVVYQTETGRVVKKWKNSTKNWSDCCIMAPETSETAIIATKSTEDEVKIWNYTNGNDVITLPGFNVSSLYFHETGNYLAAGAMEASLDKKDDKKGEIARVWELNSGDYNPFKLSDIEDKIEINGDYNNAKIYITKISDNEVEVDNESSRDILIVVCENQKPLAFYLENSQFLYECEDNDGVILSHIYEIEANPKSNALLIKGYDKKKQNHALLYNLTTGKALFHFDNCVNASLSKDEKLLLARCENHNDGKLFVMNLNDLDNIQKETVNCSLPNADISSFVQGSACLVSAFGENNKVQYILNDPKTGNKLAELYIENNCKDYCEMDVSAQRVEKEYLPESARNNDNEPDNNKENVLLFRYIQLKSDEPYDLTKPSNIKEDERSQDQ